ncbi:CPBP family intramembrane metalloprotease [Arthrobacter sp. Sa2BUA2]|uniref:CPBP family intramembrane metalloprotease n=1 Tax=Arthrobacter pullicola TaxID=2762224 RepID=A0ABR8YEU5_9MICC|nr:CPBP family intramembrane glutamic endopeptidase [Arthrobacter pullicola]MBD8042641.1 CPBP family intramembrane metalloprotease [Arthrobacter pullicola]
MTSGIKPHEGQRFGRLIERADGRDFPYYDGEPTDVAGWKWGVIILACVAGFATLLFFPAANGIQSLIPRILFPAIPLAVFIGFTGRYWTSVFKKLTGVDYLTMVIFWLLNLAVSAAVGLIVMAVFGANANPATDNVLEGGPAEVAAFYVGTGIQLFGEEVFTILPFLAIMYLLFTKAKLSRNTSVIVAWLVTAHWFGAAHLPTYGWNFAQAFVVIGAARLVLTLAYIRTKNILVSTGAHVLNDWTIFTFALVAAGAAAS